MPLSRNSETVAEIYRKLSDALSDIGAPRPSFVRAGESSGSYPESGYVVFSIFENTQEAVYPGVGAALLSEFNVAVDVYNPSFERCLIWSDAVQSELTDNENDDYIGATLAVGRSFTSSNPDALLHRCAMTFLVYGS